MTAIGDPCPFALRTAEFPDEVPVLAFRGREALSKCFAFDLTLELSDWEPREAESRLLRAPVQLIIRRSDHERHLGGVIAKTRVEAGDPTLLGQAIAPKHGFTLEARLVPHLWLYGRGKRYRIFQGKTVSEIVADVLRDGPALRFAIKREQLTREYTVQYAESDLAFFERLLADEGLTYAFEYHPDDPTETLVITDGASPLGDVQPAVRIPLRQHAGLAAKSLTIEKLSLSRSVVPQRSSVRAFDLRRPGAQTQADLSVEPEADAASHGRVDRHIGTHDTARVDAALAQRRLEQDRRRAVTGAGSSRHVGILPGVAFELVDSSNASRDLRYHVVSVDHRGQLAGERLTYENDFSCVPDATNWKPRAPKRRVVQSLETATVTGPTNQEIHTDALGRVRVHFHWDEAVAAESSCWIRVVQPWAGEGWGFQFIPRVGMEVVVGFLGGNLDTPMVLGSAVNVLHPPSYPLPTSKTRSGIKTRSTRNGTGYNELSFEDRTGYEHLFIRAERDLDLHVQNDETHRVGGTMTEHVQGNRFKLVGGNTIASHEGNVTCSIAGEERLSTSGTRFSEISGNSDSVVHGREQSLVEGNEIRVVAGSRDETVRGADHSTVEGDRTLRTQGSLTCVVGKPSANRAFQIHTEGMVGIRSSTATEIDAGERLVLRCGNASIVLTEDTIELDAPKLILRGKEAWTVLAEGDIKQSAKGKLIVDAKEKVLLKGKSSTLSLADEAKLDGPHVKLKAPDDESVDLEAEAGEITVIVLVDQDDRPMAGQRYRIVLDDGSERTGVLDDDGRAEVRVKGAPRIFFPEAGSVVGA